nr:unnamed protein product [Callosobruchus chinensis]
MDNPLTEKYFRSESAVKQERDMHIKLDYWYIVHPLSKLRNYISSIFFICDVLSSIPIQPLVCLCEVILGTSRLSIIGLFYLFCQLKFIRMISVIQYINSLSDYFRIKSKGKVFLLICIIMTTITVHGFALLQLLMPRLVRQYFAEVDDMSKMWFVKYKLHKTSFWNIYTNCVLKSSAFMLAIRNFYKFSNQEEDYLLAIVTYIVGKVMVCSTYDKLKKEINLHECKNLIQNVSLFAHLTEHQISTVVEMLTPEIFLPKDTIIQAGSLGDCMYFISSGIVAVYTHSGKEVTIQFVSTSYELQFPHVNIYKIVELSGPTKKSRRIR